MIKTYENVKDFLPEDWHKINYKIVFQKIKKDEH